MPHGGKRTGAGRKETLDLMGRLHVGARAHNFQAKITRRKAMAKFDQAMIETGVREAQEKSRSMLRTEGFEHWQNSFEGEDARDDLGFSLLTYHRLPDEHDPEDAPRLASLTWGPYGTRKHVYAVVARWASWYYGAPITPRRIRDYWAEYRQFLRET